MIWRRSVPALSLLSVLSLGVAAGCFNTVDQSTEAHAQDTRERDDQATRIRKADEKNGPKDTTVVVGQDSVKIDGG